MKALVLLSGGVDSCVLLTRLLRRVNYRVDALSIEYRTQHNEVELHAAKKIARLAEVSWDVLELGDIFGPSFLSGENEQVVVPGRNLVFIAQAMAYAIPRGYSEIHVGVTQDDHQLFPDCRIEFWRALDLATHQAYGIRLYTPFIRLSKAAVVRLGMEFQAPLQLTHSCYRGAPACGTCVACVGRAAAFQANGLSYQ